VKCSDCTKCGCKPDIELETFVVHNPDNSVSLDPYAKMTREQLKTKCGQMSRALSKWQFLAMDALQGTLDHDERTEILSLIEAYSDHEELPDPRTMTEAELIQGLKDAGLIP
jgi:hypothetical protein